MNEIINDNFFFLDNNNNNNNNNTVYIRNSSLTTLVKPLILAESLTSTLGLPPVKLIVLSKSSYIVLVLLATDIGMLLITGMLLLISLLFGGTYGLTIFTFSATICGGGLVCG